MASHQHCYVGKKLPKSKLRKRAEKARAREKSKARQQAIEEAKKAQLA